MFSVNGSVSMNCLYKKISSFFGACSLFLRLSYSNTYNYTFKTNIEKVDNYNKINTEYNNWINKNNDTKYYLVNSYDLLSNIIITDINNSGINNFGNIKFNIVYFISFSLIVISLFSSVSEINLYANKKFNGFINAS